MKYKLTDSYFTDTDKHFFELCGCGIDKPSNRGKNYRDPNTGRFSKKETLAERLAKLEKQVQKLKTFNDTFMEKVLKNIEDSFK